MENIGIVKIINYIVYFFYVGIIFLSDGLKEHFEWCLVVLGKVAQGFRRD